jgi:hypothetical protein
MPNARTMKQLILILTVLCNLHLCSFGQNNLEPCSDSNQYSGDLKEYYTNVFKFLYKGLCAKPIARYAVLPSVSPEYVVSLEKDTSGDYKFFYQTFTKRFWSLKNKKNIRTRDKIKPIDKDMALLIKELFDKVLSQIKEPPEPRLGLDGAMYYFSGTNNKGDVITGEIWSPDIGTKMHKLIEICNDINLYICDKGKNKSEIIEDIKSLITKLK